MNKLNNKSGNVNIREPRDDEHDHVAGGGLLDGLLGSTEGDVNNLLGNPGGILGTTLADAEGAAKGIVASTGA
jgi:hypothetical protein